MSSYFDNQYDGEDPDNKFNNDPSDDDDDTTSTSSEVEVIEDIENNDLEEDDDLDDEVDDDLDDEVDDVNNEVDDVTSQIGGADSELEEGEIDEVAENKTKKLKKIPAKNSYKKPVDFEDDEDDDEEGEQYLQKFDQSINDNYIMTFHPESILQNYDEILSMTKVVRDNNGIIIDKLHRTIPYLTKYEKARILGQRAKQINSGAYPFVKVPENVIDGYIIAELELKQKRIPFIIRRPLPNGGSEYWKVHDLEDISF